MLDEREFEEYILQIFQKNGWKYLPKKDLPRASSSVMVEALVKEALLKLNPELAKNPDNADLIIHKMRALFMSAKPHDLVTQNERFKDMIFRDNSYPFGENGQHISIKFFGTGDELRKNSFYVTNQWYYKGIDKDDEFDIVLLINGFPMIIGELKTPTRNAITWLDGATQISEYERNSPGMFVPNILSFATEGKCFRYGSVNLPLDKWGPWHTAWDKNEGTVADISRSITDMFTFDKVMDIFQYFTLFATDSKHRKIKIICRYQQYEGANMIVERVIAGYPKKGLIWHFQGSGKSLLMVFAAQKLRMIPALENPTVVIVVDRLDLDTQITATFNASEIANTVTAESKQELITFFKGDTRKILITMIHKFGDVDCELNDRKNIILMVDEAHRTQEGNLGEQMRMALPNAFFFGLTGTPINQTDRNTFITFGAVEDKSGYMSKYSFQDSIRDKATLPLHFETVPIEMKIDRELIDKYFDEISSEYTEEEKNEVAKRIKMKAIFTAPVRISRNCKHIVQHFKTKIEPNGFKGQIVCFDRDTCMLYKEELDTLLSPEESVVVITTQDDQDGVYRAARRNRDEEKDVLDIFKDRDSDLKLVIVCNKLLTGFDAPALQVMYLDKPMKDHNLLQAICRTNRISGDTKTHGLIVDYVGIFDNVAKALNFDEKIVQQIIKNIDEIKNAFPILIANCLKYFPDIDRSNYDFETLLLAQQCLPTNEQKDKFASEFIVLQRAYEAISPDVFLQDYKSDYVWLSKIYDSVRPVDNRGGLIWQALGPKTIQMIHENMSVNQVQESEIFRIELDADIIDKILDDYKDKPNKKIQEIEMMLKAKIKQNPENVNFIKIGEKMEQLKEKHEKGLYTSIEFLKLLLELAREMAQAEKETTPKEEINKGKAALTELFNSVKNINTPILIERIVNDIDDVVKKVRFNDWKNFHKGRNEVKKALRSIIYLKYQIQDSEVFDKAYSYIEMYY